MRLEQACMLGLEVGTVFKRNAQQPTFLRAQLQLQRSQSYFLLGTPHHQSLNWMHLHQTLAAKGFLTLK